MQQGASSDPARAAAIDRFLSAELDRYVGETARLCAEPSVSAKGEDLTPCAELVGDLLRRHGFDARILPTPGNPVVVGRAAGRSARTLLMYTHYDVQPPEPLELWTTPPFEPAVRDGALYARGAKDDKGELVARVAAVDAARQANGGELPCGITFVVEGQEEVGSPHIAAFVREHTDLLACQGALWEEGWVNEQGRSELHLGYRGILAVELSVEVMRRDAHSGSASILPNAAWRLVWALASLKGPDERVQIPGFYDAARPPSELDRRLAAEMPSLEEELRRDYGLTGVLRGATGDALKLAVFEPTCTVEGITTGYQGKGVKTVIPARASAKVDFRLVPDMDPDDVEARLKAHLAASGFPDVVVTRHGAMWPARTAPDDPLVELTSRTAAEVYGKPSQLVPFTGGSSPAYAFARPLGGIPVVNAGVGYSDSRVHAPDEHVRLSDFLAGARHIARIVDGFAAL